MLHRIINLPKSHSFFLFGARGTGKTTLLKSARNVTSTLYIDLLDLNVESGYLKDPGILEHELRGLPKEKICVVIDEIQKVPRLLDTVHRWIEMSKLQFIMTGSSARKLRRGASNSLAGRAFVLNLFPLTVSELGEAFELTAALEYGLLPAVQALDDAEKQRYLRSYAQSYLKEEVWNEQLVRNLQPFAQFLEVAAQTNGEIINYSKAARDIGVDPKTVESYYQILEDTLVGFFLRPYHRSVRKRQVVSPKFYLFECGVKRVLDGTLNAPLQPKTYAYGKAFEHFIMLELLKLNHYGEKDFRFSYLNTHDGLEIDLVIERPGLKPALVEIKSTDRVDTSDVRALQAIKKDFGKCELFVISRDERRQIIEDTVCLPWTSAFDELGL